MRLPVDDDVHRIDSVWLGPKEFTLPWRARYKAYAVGLGVLLLLRFIQDRLGVPITFWTVAYTLFAAVVITTLIGRWITFERGVGALAAAMHHEIAAPRPPSTKTERILWRTDRVSVQAAPERRKTRRRGLAKATRKPKLAKTRKTRAIFRRRAK